MARIILVDDSASARKLLGVRLSELGHEVQDVATAAEAAELAITRPPQAIVTDLWMPGISGLQLCRLLRAEQRTAHIPIVLLTASDDRRSRFWARHAGATAYVTKTEVDRLIAVVNEAVRGTVPPPPSANTASTTRGTVQERLSQLLDDALYDSTVAGQVRTLSHSADDIEKLFSELVAVASDVIGYRWLGLVIEEKPSSRIFVHTHPDQREAAEREARDALGIQVHEERRKAAEDRMHVVLDTRAVAAEWTTPPTQLAIRFGTTLMGAIAIAPARRGASHEDRRFVSLLADELGGPLQMSALVAEARRLAATDSLTGLLNRRAFVEGITKARAKDAAFHPVSVLLLDIDHFKKVNDTRGHEAGDLVLQGVARVLANIARKSDLLARWGGEEFVLVLSGTAEAGARVAAERVRRAIADAEYTLPNGETISATASVGLASSTGTDWQLDDLLGRADRAMYAAKARGRNRVEKA